MLPEREREREWGERDGKNVFKKREKNINIWVINEI